MQADRLTRLVSNLLDMTRIQAGVLEVRRAPWSVIDLVDDVVTELRPSLEDRTVVLDVPTALPLVDVDHLLIEQVLANLLDNAHRHSPPESPIVVAAKRWGTDHVAVSVTDQGSGSARGRAHCGLRDVRPLRHRGRAGLGLAIAKAFIEAHGERIWVEDPPGGGARFIFTLPFAKSERAHS